jgi:hypothetical protein
MSAQHTPGPWTVGGPNGYLNQIQIEPAIGAVYGAGEELKANARLIAAAPELLQVLRAFMECNRADPNRNRATEGVWLTINAPRVVVDAAAAVIAKATGEQS